MTTTIHPQTTAAPAPVTGPFTAPLQVIRAAGARHREAIAEHGALPGWALAAVAVIAAGLCIFGVIEWRDVASPLLIGCTLIGALAAFTPDLLAARAVRTAADTEA